MSVEVVFEGQPCHEGEFDTPAQAKRYIEQIRTTGGYWMSIQSVKTEIFIPWHTIREVRVQPKGTKAKEND